MKKLVILGTYWNESQWIDRSLAQVKSIKPDLVILCDGCFDETQENRSTDGTEQKIFDFCSENSNSLKYKAKRYSRFRSMCYLLKVGLKKKFSLAYIYWVLKHAIKTDRYRLNQAVTFNYMLEIAINKFGTDFWFMTYDADQFYDDKYVKDFKVIINNLCDECILLTAKELTFNNDFDHCTDKYESRVWNNFPHKHKRNTVILPTRDIKISNFLSVKKYFDYDRSHVLGKYYHYKFRELESRSKMTYQLGDRKAPTSDRISNEFYYNGEHPKVIGKL